MNKKKDTKALKKAMNCNTTRSNRIERQRPRGTGNRVMYRSPERSSYQKHSRHGIIAILCKMIGDLRISEKNEKAAAAVVPLSSCADAKKKEDEKKDDDQDPPTMAQAC